MASADRKEEIRKQAAEVFAERGFDRASIRDLARLAGMSLAGLYYYYRGKDEILYDIQRGAFRTLLDQHAGALAGVTDPERKLKQVIDGHLAFFAANLAEMKVMSRESEQLEGELAAEVSGLRRRYFRLVRGIIEEIGRDRPLKENVRPAVAAFLLFGMMNWMYTWYDADRDGTAADLARAVREIFLGGILA